MASGAPSWQGKSTLDTTTAALNKPWKKKKKNPPLLFICFLIVFQFHTVQQHQQTKHSFSTYYTKFFDKL